MAAPEPQDSLPCAGSLAADFGLDNDLDAICNFMNFEAPLDDQDLGVGPSCLPMLGNLPSHGDELSDPNDLPGSIKLETDLDDLEDGKGQTGPQGKRRRRIRNAKQQELNRLAQQRYRQRKKQRYVDLQSTVDLLQEKMNALEILEKEASSLRASRQELTKQVQQREAAIAQMQQHLKQQEEVLKTKDEKIVEQSRIIEEQQQHLKLMGADPQTLCERLTQVIRMALVEAGSQPSFQEQVLQHVKTTLTGCSRDLLHKPAKQTNGGDTPPAIPVSCC